jgi:hypothetical protein
MATIMVGYDLRKPGRDYNTLIEYLKGLGGWWHCLDSTWLIQTGMAVSELRDRLATLIDANDSVLVLNIATKAWANAGMSAKCTDWLRSNL